MRTGTLAFLAAGLLLAGPATSQDVLNLSVLYLGSPGSDRASAFEAFLTKHFKTVRVADRTSWDRAAADDVDVVVLDWPQKIPPTERPLGERETWTTPTVLLGSAGLNLAVVWDVRGGSG